MPLRPLSQGFAPGALIPSAWANDIGLNINNVLDQRTGTDPPGPGLLLISTGPATGGWRYLQAGDYRAGTIPDTALANPHVYRHNQTSLLTFSAAGALGSGFFDIGTTDDAPPSGGPNWLLVQNRHHNWGVDYRFQFACSLTDVNEVYVRTIVSGAPTTAWRKLWHAGNLSLPFLPLAGGTLSGPGTLTVGGLLTAQAGLTVSAGILTAAGAANIAGLLTANGGTFTADLMVRRSGGTAGQGYLVLGNNTGVYFGYDGTKHILVTPAFHVQNDLYVYRSGASATGYIILGTNPANYIGYTGTQYVAGGYQIITALNIGSQNVAQVGGRTPTNVAQPNAIPISDASGKLDAWITGGGSGGGAHTHSGDAIIPTTVNGAPVSPTPGANRIPVSNASGKLDNGWLPAVGGGSDVPIGMIALWDQAVGLIPAGWTLHTSFQGRFPLAAGGTTMAPAPALGNTGGGITHAHDFNVAHGHNDTIDFNGTVTASSGSSGRLDGGNLVASDGHTHGFTRTKSGGVTDVPNPTTVRSGNVADPTTGGHLPPWYALHYIRKT